jgi:hypothetical protein
MHGKTKFKDCIALAQQILRGFQWSSRKTEMKQQGRHGHNTYKKKFSLAKQYIKT